MAGRTALFIRLCLALPALMVGFDPLVQRQRPPQQTAAQLQAQQRLVANAQAQSDAAKASLLDYLDSTVRPALQGTTLAKLSAQDLLDGLTWEFKRLPLIHNAPMDSKDPAGIADDTALEVTITNSYLQNVCHRYALGVEGQANLQGEHNIMVNFMGLPRFAKDLDPTMREANDCVLYVANNLRKADAGNIVFGSLTYAVNPTYSSQFTLTGFDTGAYSQGNPVKFGTLDHFYHLVLDHVRVLKYNLADVFKRWWIPGTPPPHLGQFPYFEVQWFGNAWVPESLLYVLAKFSADGGGEGVWGTPVGKSLRDFMRDNGRPLLWADGDDSGILLDPSVGGIAGGQISQGDIDMFEQFWSTPASSTSWKALYAKAAPYLRFSYRSWTTSSACAPLEADPSNMILGNNGEGKCVYWRIPQQPSRWECLNDGTCGPSVKTAGTFPSEQDCLSNCGGGQWGCITGGQGARQDAHHCEPDFGGSCSDLQECESKCGTKSTCGSPLPPPGPHTASWLQYYMCGGGASEKIGDGYDLDACWNILLSKQAEGFECAQLKTTAGTCSLWKNPVCWPNSDASSWATSLGFSQVENTSWLSGLFGTAPDGDIAGDQQASWV